MKDVEEKYANKSGPFSKERTKIIVCRIIYFYSLFFVIMKGMAIASGYAFWPNLIVALPFVGFALLGFRLERQKKYSWLYVILGIVVISAIRYYELELLHYLSTLT